MICPVDKSDMIIVEHNKVELDYCLRCSGVWFDCDELELLLEIIDSSEGRTCGDIISPEKAKVTEAQRKCPVCGHKMDKVWMGKSPKVLIDSCPLGDGLWFDGGELHHVLRQMGSEGAVSEDVISFLGDALHADQEEKQ